MNLGKLGLPTEPVERTFYEINDLELWNNAVVVNVPISISDSRIEGVVNLSNAQFKKRVNFERTNFARKSEFWGSHFEGDTSFGEAQFDADAIFEGISFKGISSFEGISFESTGIANFNGAKFNQLADFDGATFGVVNFVGTQFSGYSSFWKAHFNGQNSFKRVRFDGDADFESAVFDENADMIGAQFSGNAYFYDSTTFDKNFNLNGSKLNKFYIYWDSIKDHIIFDPALYLSLIKSYKDIGWFDDADECYYQLRVEQLHHRNPKNDPLMYLLDFGAWIFYGFGKKPLYPMLWSAFFVVLFGSFWTVIWQKKSKGAIAEDVVNQSWPKNILEAFRFSANVFLSGTKFFVDPPETPKTIRWSRSFVGGMFTLERVLGAIFSILLVLAIGGTIVRKNFVRGSHPTHVIAFTNQQLWLHHG